jgi:hypothetical protein
VPFPVVAVVPGTVGTEMRPGETRGREDLPNVRGLPQCVLGPVHELVMQSSGTGDQMDKSTGDGREHVLGSGTTRLGRVLDVRETSGRPSSLIREPIPPANAFGMAATHFSWRGR